MLRPLGKAKRSLGVGVASPRNATPPSRGKAKRSAAWGWAFYRGISILQVVGIATSLPSSRASVFQP